MKKILSILLVAIMLFIPFGVNAEGEEPVDVYLFYGSTCPHCQELHEWFETVDQEEQAKYNLIKFEVWENEKNAELMDKVGEALGQQASGVPFMIIGEKVFSGYGEGDGEEILKAIDDEYKNDNRSTKVKDVIEKNGGGEPDGATNTSKKESKTSDLIIGIVAIVIIVGTIFVVVKAREE